MAKWLKWLLPARRGTNTLPVERRARQGVTKEIKKFKKKYERVIKSEGRRIGGGFGVVGWWGGGWEGSGGTWNVRPSVYPQRMKTDAKIAATQKDVVPKINLWLRLQSISSENKPRNLTTGTRTDKSDSKDEMRRVGEEVGGRVCRLAFTSTTASPLPTIGPFLDEPGLFFLSFCHLSPCISPQKSPYPWPPRSMFCSPLLLTLPSPGSSSSLPWIRRKAPERVPFTCVLPPCPLVCPTLSDSPQTLSWRWKRESVQLAVHLESPARASKPPSLFSQNTEIVNLPLACSLVLNVLLGQSGSWY